MVFSYMCQSPPPVRAESEETDDMFDMSLDELMNIKIEVASLFQESDLVVGSSVVRVCPNDWEKLGARRYQEALNNQPGVATFWLHGGTPLISVRGFTRSFGRSDLSIMVDGVPMTEMANGSSTQTIPNWQLGTLNEMEMIKGPGSAIYGSDAFHGVLSLNTFESQTDHYSAQISGAYPASYQGNIQLSRGFANDRFRFDMAFGYGHQGDMKIDSSMNNLDVSDSTTISNAAYGSYKDVTTREKRKFDNYTGVVKLTYKTSNDLTTRISGYINDSETDDYPASGDMPGFDLSDERVKTYMGTGSISYMFANEISMDLSGYSWKTDQNLEVNTGEPLAGALILDYGDNYILLEKRGTRSGLNLTIKQPDNLMNLQWLVGYSWSTMEITDTRFSFMRHSTGLSYKYPAGFGPLTGQPIKDDPEAFDGMERDVHGFFTQLKWEVIQDLFILGGARLDDYSDFGSQFTPRAGLIYLPTPFSAMKLLYGNAFRAPSGGELKDAAGGFIAGDEDLKPEEIDVYELIYMCKGKTWKMNATLFYTRWKNGIVLSQNPAFDPGDPTKEPSDIFSNTGKSLSYGAELESIYSKGRWVYDLGFSYVRSEARDLIDLNTGETHDRDFKMFPRIMLNWGMICQLDAYKTRVYLNNRIMAEHYDTHYDRIPETGPRGPKELPVYWRTDLNISTNITDDFDLIMDVRNLFDRKNYVGAVWGNRNRKGHEEEGISVMLSLRYTM